VLVPQPIPKGIIGFHQKEGVDRDLILYSGLVSEEYGLDIAIDALRRVRKERPTARLVITGYGKIPNEMIDRIAKLELSDAVELAGFIASEEEFLSLVRTARAGWAPYNPMDESCKRFTDVGKPKMYMANGVPPVITAVPAIARIISEERAGIVVDYAADELARATLKLMNDDVLWSDLRMNGLRLARQYDDVEIARRTFEAMGFDV
jgi:glycosyltransferase involved in cell wall biosynthesis